MGFTRVAIQRIGVSARTTSARAPHFSIMANSRFGLSRPLPRRSYLPELRRYLLRSIDSRLERFGLSALIGLCTLKYLTRQILGSPTTSGLSEI